MGTKYSRKEKKVSGNYTTTQAKRHLQDKHKDVEEVKSVQAISSAKILKKTNKIVTSLKSSHTDLGTSENTGKKKKHKSTIQSLLPGVPSWKDISLPKQAHWQIYSKQAPSISSFRDDYFIEILKGMVPPEYKTSGNLPILTEEMLKRYIYMLKNNC